MPFTRPDARSGEVGLRSQLCGRRGGRSDRISCCHGVQWMQCAPGRAAQSFLAPAPTTGPQSHQWLVAQRHVAGRGPLHYVDRDCAADPNRPNRGVERSPICIPRVPHNSLARPAVGLRHSCCSQVKSGGPGVLSVVTCGAPACVHAAHYWLCAPPLGCGQHGDGGPAHDDRNCSRASAVGGLSVPHCLSSAATRRLDAASALERSWRM